MKHNNNNNNNTEKDSTTRVRIPQHHKHNIKWLVKTGASVQEGETIAFITAVVEVKEKQKQKLCAPSAGFISILEKPASFEKEDFMLDQVVVAQIEACTHPTVLGKLCAVCGMMVDDVSSEMGSSSSSSSDQQYRRSNPIGFSNVKKKVKEQRAITVNGGITLSISQQEAENLGNQSRQKLHSVKKLSLVLDLDHTLVHATSDYRAARFLSEAEDVRTLLLSPHRQAFGQHPQHLKMQPLYTRHIIKLRPHIKEFFNVVNDLYEVSIYTAGTREYALKVADLICRHIVGAKDEEQMLGLKASIEKLERAIAKHSNSEEAERSKTIQPTISKVVSILNSSEDKDPTVKKEEEISVKQGDNSDKKSECNDVIAHDEKGPLRSVDSEVDDCTKGNIKEENNQVTFGPNDINEVSNGIGNTQIDDATEKKKEMLSHRSIPRNIDEQAESEGTKEMVYLQDECKSKESNPVNAKVDMIAEEVDILIDSKGTSTSGIMADVVEESSESSKMNKEYKPINVKNEVISKEVENSIDTKGALSTANVGDESCKLSRSEEAKLCCSQNEEDDNLSKSTFALVDESSSIETNENINGRKMDGKETSTVEVSNIEKEGSNETSRKRESAICAKAKLEQPSKKRVRFDATAATSSIETKKEELNTIRAELEAAILLETKAKRLLKTIFGSRIVSRCDVGDLGRDVKDLNRVFPCGGVMSAIVDDREDVWANAKGNLSGKPGEPPLNLLLVRPYHWQPFADAGFKDVNNVSGADLSEPDKKTSCLIDEDDEQLGWTADILKRLHKTYYSFHQNGNTRSVSDILAEMRTNVLGKKCTKIILSGLLPLHVQRRLSDKNRPRPAYVRYVEDLGGKVTKNVSKCVTHVIASQEGTDKVKWGFQHKGCYVVKPAWLLRCFWALKRIPEDSHQLRNRETTNVSSTHEEEDTESSDEDFEAEMEKEMFG